MENTPLNNVNNANSSGNLPVKESFFKKYSGKLNSFYVQCQRVWIVLRKPTKDELIMIAKVAGLGILVIGALGFIISDVIKILDKVV